MKFVIGEYYYQSGKDERIVQVITYDEWRSDIDEDEYFDFFDEEGMVYIRTLKTFKGIFRENEVSRFYEYSEAWVNSFKPLL